MIIEQRSPMESLAAYALAFVAGAVVVACSQAYAEWLVRRETGNSF